MNSDSEIKDGASWGSQRIRRSTDSHLGRCEVQATMGAATITMRRIAARAGRVATSASRGAQSSVATTVEVLTDSSSSPTPVPLGKLSFTKVVHHRSSVSHRIVDWEGVRAPAAACTSSANDTARSTAAPVACRHASPSFSSLQQAGHALKAFSALARLFTAQARG